MGRITLPGLRLMPAAAIATRRTADIEREIDHERTRGPLQQIVIAPCPARLVRLQAALAPAEPQLQEVAAIAASDVAMAATLLRYANGPRFAAAQPVQTIGQAMYRLGLNETAEIMLGFIARTAIPANHRQLQRFWERSQQRALAMSYIAHQLPGLSSDVAHTFGLFCHVGIPVLLQSMKGYGGTMVEGDARIDRPYIATENANHRTDHAVVGALVARVWRLAPSVVAAIRLHHEPHAIGGSGVDAEVHTLVAAGLVAEHLMRRHEGLPPEGEWVQHASAAMVWLGIAADDIQHWQQELQPRLDAA
jgi:HD-like signal output (HDOD) protein